MESQLEKYKQSLFGLLGKNISYSFSKSYFSEKFSQLGLKEYRYENFDIASITDFPELINQHKTLLRGFNVTIPYKQEIIPYLDEIDEVAEQIGAVNTVKISPTGKLIGHNTDVIGFRESLKPLIQKHHKKALVLGTGGASFAICFALQQLKIAYLKVSRSPQQQNEISYAEINQDILKEYSIIINCTPLGTHPNINEKPTISYSFLGKQHLLYDLVYNPAVTAFLAEGKIKNATIKNGLEMLELQAEESWKIWQ